MKVPCDSSVVAATKSFVSNPKKRRTLVAVGVFTFFAFLIAFVVMEGKGKLPPSSSSADTNGSCCSPFSEGKPVSQLVLILFVSSITDDPAERTNLLTEPCAEQRYKRNFSG
jgi:hypothetical protein